MTKIGEIKKARELGRPRLTDKYIWWLCPVCNKPRWIQMRHGKPAYPKCRRCSNLELTQRPHRKPRYSMVGENNPHWRGGLVESVCLECSKPFSVKPSVIKKGYGKFCSYLCWNIYNRRLGVFSNIPTKPEGEIIDICKKYHLPYKYVGDGQVWLGNCNPDFINTNGKKQVIEMLGTYWHPLFDGARKIEHYRQFSFDCLIIWEDEFHIPNKVDKKLKRFNLKGKHNDQ